MAQRSLCVFLSSLLFGACAVEPAAEEPGGAGGKADGQACTAEGYATWLSGYKTALGRLSGDPSADLALATAAAASQPCGEANDEAYAAWRTMFTWGIRTVEGWTFLSDAYETATQEVGSCIGIPEQCAYILQSAAPTDHQLRNLGYLLLARPPGGVEAQRAWIADYARFVDAAGAELSNAFGVIEAAYTLSDVERPLLGVLAEARPRASAGDAYAQWLAVFDKAVTGATAAADSAELSGDERAFLEAIATTRPCGDSPANVEAFEAFAARFAEASADVTDAIAAATPTSCEDAPAPEPEQPTL